MGTNYYIERNADCDIITSKFEIDPAVSIHIGKRSAGWQFHFRGYHTIVSTYQRWKELISEALELGWELRDEYGTRFTAEQFFDLVAETRGRRVELPDDTLDPDGWQFTYREFC